MPSETNAVDQWSWRRPDPMMAPPVAAADTSPARTPARIRVDGTERKETAGFDTLKGRTYPADLPVR